MRENTLLPGQGLHLILNTEMIQAAVAIKISNLLICFCSFELSCPIHEKENFLGNMYIVVLII